MDHKLAFVSTTNLPSVPGFDVQGKIADGGLSEVFMAYRADGSVALKMLSLRLLADRNAHKKMAHEGAMGMRLDHHANVIKTLGRGKAKNRPYLVLEYFPSQSLRDILKKRKRVGLLEAIAIGQQIAAGLGHIHAAGIIHRDVKPENILVGNKGHCKIIDLGIGTTKFASLFPWTRTASGSPSYMSPEQIRKQRVDERSDIYSFGCTLYELVAGRKPYSAGSTGQLVQLHLNARTAPKPPSQNGSDVPLDLDQLILACLKTNPADRPLSTTRILGDLRKIAQSAARRAG